MRLSRVQEVQVVNCGHPFPDSDRHHPSHGQASDRLRLLKRMPRAAVCAEIGVWAGEFSKTILEMTSPRRLHLIDPWLFLEEFPDRWYGGKRARTQQDMDEIFQNVRSMFREAPEVRIHRGLSHDVLRQFDSHYFDWIYIDGSHSYEYVRADLELSLPRTKPGGVIAGDDYCWGQQDGFPVRRAVRDFVEEHGLGTRLEVFGDQFIIGV